MPPFPMPPVPYLRPHAPVPRPPFPPATVPQATVPQATVPRPPFPRPAAPGHPQGVALLYTSHAGALYIVGPPLAGGLGRLACGGWPGEWVVYSNPLRVAWGGWLGAAGLGSGSCIVGPPLAGGLRRARTGLSERL